MVQAARAEGAWLDLLIGPPALATVAELIHTADRILNNDEAYLAEARVVDAAQSCATDGVPSDTGGPAPDSRDLLARRDFGGPPRAPGHDYETDLLVGVLGSSADSPLDDLIAGQALQSVLLTATSAGLVASLMSQPIDVPRVREQLRIGLRRYGPPQILLRAGYGVPGSPTRRRPTSEVLLSPEVFEWLHEVDDRFSTYRTDSEVSRLDRGDIALTDCSDDMRLVLAECARLWQVTDGYFDAYASGRLDPSGFVKGWSVQVASERLTAAGAVNHFVDAGGDIQTRGRPAPGRRWIIPVRHPWEPDRACWVLSGTDLAVATSGTYERGRHVIDPRTGEQPAALRAVTVVGRDLAVADAYATAAIAMGPRALSWLADLDGYEAGSITDDRGSYRSDGLQRCRGRSERSGLKRS